MRGKHALKYALNCDAIRTAPPPFPSSAEILRGKYVSLAPPDLAGDSVFAELFSASHGDARRESVWGFLPYGKFADARAMADFYRAAGADGDPMFYVVRNENGASGIASYLRIFPDSYSIEIGHIWHSAKTQGGRANTETAFLLMERAFALGYRRLEWKCNAMNMKSRRAALRLGLAFEGVFRQCTASKGKNRDTAWFAVLDRDWPAVRANIREWLDAPPQSFSLAEKNLSQVEWSLPAHEFWSPPATDAKQ
ncbi:MAG: GNAT family N-acetyltransferase [Gammaproteobacteria bacterium]